MKRFALFSNQTENAPVSTVADTQVNQVEPVSQVAVKVQVSERPHILKQRQARRARRAAI